MQRFALGSSVRILSCLFILLIPNIVKADLSNGMGLGSFTGTINLTVSMCPVGDEAFEGTFTGQYSTTVTQPDPTQAAIATGSHNAGSGAIFESLVFATGSNTFSVLFQNTNDSPTLFSGSATGSFSNDFNSFTQSGSGLSEGCTFTFSVSASRSNEVVNPETAPSNTITSAGTVQAEVVALSSDVSTRTADVLRGKAFGAKETLNGFIMEFGGGLNAGDLPTPLGMWSSYSYNDFENDFVGVDGRTDFDGERHSFLGGVDFTLGDRAVVGVAFGYEFSDIDTTFNGGEQETDGFSVIPYLGFVLSDILSIDASFGYSWIETDQFRTDPGTSVIVTSDFDSERVFAAANLNGFKQYGQWLFGFRTGILWADNEQDEFTESNGAMILENNIKLVQVSIGGDVAYQWGNFEPFIGATYENDISFQEVELIGIAQPANDDDDVLFRAGLRYFNQDNISGNFEYSKRLGREDFDEDMINVSLRVEF